MTASNTAHRHLRTSLVAGSLYDILFALLTLALPGPGSTLLGIPLPSEQVYLRFLGVFLIIMALFYMLPVFHPGRYLGNVTVAIIGRGMGAVFLATAALGFGLPRMFLLLAAGDALFAILHAVFLARAEGGNPLRHYFD